MAIFVCEEKTFWKGRLYRRGERIKYPDAQADLVPRHFARVDEGPAEDGPEPELITDKGTAPTAAAKPSAKAAKPGPQGYDAREVAYLAGMQASKRNKLLAQLKVKVPGNSSRDEVAALIIDAARAKGIDPLPKTVRAKLLADPEPPQLLGKDAPEGPPERKADPSQEDASGVPIAST